MKIETVPDKKIVPKKKPAPKKKTTKVIAAKPKQEIAIKSETSLLLQMGMRDSGLDIEKFKLVIDLKNQEEDRACKKDFDFHFAEMQKEFTPISRTKKGQFGLYAPLEKMIEKYLPIITDHGISYWWETDINKIIVGDKSYKRTYIVLAGYGHERKKTFFDAPGVEPNNAQSEIQAAGVENTYSQRYTFKAGFGIAEIDEDTDGNLIFSDAVNYADDIVWLKSCTNKEDLLTQLNEISVLTKNVLNEIYNILTEDFNYFS